MVVRDQRRADRELPGVGPDAKRRRQKRDAAIIDNIVKEVDACNQTAKLRTRPAAPTLQLQEVQPTLSSEEKQQRLAQARLKRQ